MSPRLKRDDVVYQAYALLQRPRSLRRTGDDDILNLILVEIQALRRRIAELESQRK